MEINGCGCSGDEMQRKSKTESESEQKQHQVSPPKLRIKMFKPSKRKETR